MPRTRLEFQMQANKDTNKEKQQRWRDRMKEDEAIHEKFKEKEMKRVSDYRAAKKIQMTEDKEAQKKRERERKAAYRKKKREDIHAARRNVDDIQEETEHSREQEKRSARTERQRLRVCLRVTKHRSKKKKIIKSPDMPEEQLQKSPGHFKNRQSLYKAKQRTLSILPSSSKRKLQVLGSVLKDLPKDQKRSLVESPNKQSTSDSKEDETVTQVIIEAVRDSINDANQSNTPEISKAKVMQVLTSPTVFQKKMQRKVARALNLNPKSFTHQYTRKVAAKAKNVALTIRKRRKDAAEAEFWSHVIKEFFRNEPVSRASADSKDVYNNRKDGSKTPKRFLQTTVQKAFIMFKEEHPDYPFKFSVFRRSRPRDVNRKGEQHRKVCLCVKHANIELKFDALVNLYAASKESKPQMLTSVEDLSNATVCDTRRIDCIKRNCDNCGVGKLDEVLNKKLASKTITHEKWDYVEIKKGTKRRKLVTITVSGEDFFKELKSELEPFAKHVFTSLHQNSALNTILKNLPVGHAVSVLDFAENYSCLLEGEIQSAHWTIDQVTVHPMMFYLHHKDSTVENRRILKVAIIAISDDLQHDGTAVVQFLRRALGEIAEMDDVHPVTKLHEFTDGCAAQYKGKHAFTDLTYSLEDLGITTIRNFFESGHGKGPCDGLGATVKHCAKEAVLQGTLIRDSKELFTFCQENLLEVAATATGKRKEDAINSRRIFIYEDKDTLKQLRSNRQREDATVKGTRNLHFAAPVKPYILQHRSLSCYCPSCIEGNYSTCLNSHTCGHVETIKMTDGKWESHKFASEAHVALSEILVSSSSTVSVMTDGDNRQQEMTQSFANVMDSKEDAKYTTGQFIAVDYGRKYYIGQVMNVTEDGLLEMKFMHQSSLNGRVVFTWPRCPDVDKINPKAVVYGPVQHPLYQGSDKFEIRELSTIDRKFSERKGHVSL